MEPSANSEIKLEDKRTDYNKLHRIGEGAYATVNKSIRVKTDELVAIKKIKIHAMKDGVDQKEIKSLQSLDHPNIIKLQDYYDHKGCTCLVFDYLPFSIMNLLQDETINLSEGDIKAYTQPIFSAIQHAHGRNVIHRDLTTWNIMVNDRHHVYVCDLGSARPLPGDATTEMTPGVVTRWYRSPEVLYGSKTYNKSLDMWALGCILAEFYTRQALFKGSSDIDQLTQIVDLLGHPCEENWPDIANLPTFLGFNDTPAKKWSDVLPGASEAARDLISKLIVWDPKQRLTIDQALAHEFFTAGSPTTDLAKLPKLEVIIKKGGDDDDDY